jgi:hypothetical protein
VPASKNSRIQSRRKRRTAKVCSPKKRRKTMRTSAMPLPERRSIANSTTSESGRELWIAEKTSLSREKDALPWSTHFPGASDARLLELADIALGLRKAQPFRRRRSLFLSGQQH